jgi:hypothetical protein
MCRRITRGNNLKLRSITMTTPVVINPAEVSIMDWTVTLIKFWIAGIIASIVVAFTLFIVLALTGRLQAMTSFFEAIS